MALLKTKATNLEKPEVKEKGAKDALGRTYGTGRRKNSIARVWIKSGNGKFSVNTKSMNDYFAIETLQMKIMRPMAILNMLGKFDVFCTVKGGGHSGQAGAIQLGIARALDKFDEAFHTDLRQNGMLTRDARVVERKKYGKHKARRSTQFSKR